MLHFYLAEKPSLGRTIGEALGGGRREPKAIRGPGWVVSWCVGHLLEQAMPEDYDKRLSQWRREDLPILPEQWKLLPKAATRDQLQIIRGLLKEADLVINCGDPDREGQLLVDEVLEHLRWRGRTLRAWLPDLSERALRRALEPPALRSNGDYRGLRDAARGRARADWLVGMNLSRAMTLANRCAGGDALISIGRVQTPTLKLVVDRDREIEHFVPKDYFMLRARFAQGEVSYLGDWQPPEEYADEEGRCLDRARAEAVRDRVHGQPGSIVRLEVKERREAPPLPFSLNELQQAASRRLGLSAQRTLELAQALYERHKLLTYPRTDCRYLAANQHADAPAVLAALERGGYREAVAAADPGRRSRAFDDKRISAHTAIVPTAKAAPTHGLSDQERALYDMVARTYLAQFYPEHRYQATTVITECVGERFRSTGRRALEIGWKALFPAPKSAAEQGETSEQTLPELVEGEVICRQPEVLARQTRPPAHYTEGTLIRAMANIARLVEDERIRRTLRENQGIGTEATRAGIIETLKRRGFISVRGRSLLATPLGGALVDSAPAQLTSPAITAWWEQQLALIAEGSGELAVFEARAADWIRRLLPTIGRERFNAPLRAPDNRPAGKGGKSKRRPGVTRTPGRRASRAKRHGPRA